MLYVQQSVDHLADLTTRDTDKRFGLASRHEAKASTTRGRPASALFQLDARLVASPTVSIDRAYELVECESPPLPRIEELGLQPAEKAFGGSNVLRARPSRIRANEIGGLVSL